MGEVVVRGHHRCVELRPTGAIGPSIPERNGPCGSISSATSPVDFRERKRMYHLPHRLNAMAWLPDWYADPATRERRAAEHRAFVRDYLY